MLKEIPYGIAAQLKYICSTEAVQNYSTVEVQLQHYCNCAAELLNGEIQ